MNITRKQAIEALLALPLSKVRRLLREATLAAGGTPSWADPPRYIFPVIRTLLCDPSGSGVGGRRMPDFDVTGIHLGVEPNMSMMTRKKEKSDE